MRKILTLILALVSIAALSLTGGATPASANNGSALGAHWSDYSAEFPKPYVYLVDMSGDPAIETRSLEWAHYINELHNTANGNFPVVMWYRAADINWPYGLNSCNETAVERVIVICRSTTRSNWGWATHFVGGHVPYGQAFVGSANASQLTHTVRHELYHTIGLNHNSSCASVMSNCASGVDLTNLDRDRLNQIYYPHNDF